MLSREKRLTREDFSKKSRNTSSHGEFLSVSVLDRPSFKGSVIVSKKVLSRAVDRNTLRRRLYAILGTLPYTNGWYVVYAKKGAGARTHAQLKQELHSILKVK